MAHKKKKVVESYSFLNITVHRFEISIDAAVNYEVRDTNHLHDGLKVFRFDSTLELYGTDTAQEKQAADNYRITMHGKQIDDAGLNLKLNDRRMLDEKGMPVYRNRRGCQVPVYDIPDGIGLLEKERGKNIWNGWIWIPQESITQMITLLSSQKQSYLSVHEHRINRKRWINGISIQTSNPLEE